MFTEFQNAGRAVRFGIRDRTTRALVGVIGGQGHVVVYGDEWITYTGEWTGRASCLGTSGFTNTYDPCYQKSPAQIFQISQLWYNTIMYAASSVGCFDIRAPGILR